MSTHRAVNPRDPGSGRHRGESAAAAAPASPRRHGVAALLAAAIVATGMPTAWAVTDMVAKRPTRTAKAATSANLVVNGDFEEGTTGWRVNRKAVQRLDTGAPSVSGAAAGQATTTETATAVFNDAAPTVGSTTAGQGYTVTAFVRSMSGQLDGLLRLREVSPQGDVTISKTRFQAIQGSWTAVQLAHTSASSGGRIDLNIVAHDVGQSSGLMADDVVMVESPASPKPSPTASTSASATASASGTPTPSPSPTKSTSATPSPSTTPSPTPTPSPTATTTAPPGSCVADPMGIPVAGQTYVGAAVGGGNTIEGRESQFGRTLRVHRTYYSADRITAAVRTATDDVAKGRLPWISFKAPYSWSAMASGQGDAWARDLADGLATVPGPVWLAVHHEPEKDGDMTQWTAMQARIAPIIHARSDNVAYTVIYSGWNTFGGGKNTLATKWPGDANVDVTAIDAYNDFGVVRGGREGDTQLEIRAYYEKLSAWARAHGTAWGIAELGQSIKGAKNDPTWLTRAYDDMRALGGAAFSYFDNNENSVTDWRLNDTVKAQQYRGFLPVSPRIC